MNTSSSCREAVCHDRRAKCSVLANLSSIQQLILSAVSLALIRSCSFRGRPTMVRNNERCRLLRSSAVYHQRIDVVLLMKTIVHHHVVVAAIRKPPSDWKRPPGRPNHMWLKDIESDLRPLNIGPSYTWKKTASREHWRSIVNTAALNKLRGEERLMSATKRYDKIRDTILTCAKKPR